MRFRFLASLSLAAIASCGGSSAPDAADDASTNFDTSSADVANEAGNDAPSGDASGDTSINFDASDAADPCGLADPALASSKWAAVASDGTLSYATLPTGEHLLDFSYAGFGGGGEAPPYAPTYKTVSPSGGDDTAAIQAAIDALAKETLDSGVRGAIQLSPGTFEIDGTITIGVSGILLRGSGSSGAGGTTLHLVGSPRTAIVLAGTGSWKSAGEATTITDDYVPSGAMSFHVKSTAALSVGATILVDRPVTAEWIHFMGMDTLTRDGAAETWLAPGSVIHQDLVVKAIAGDLVTVDAPISDSFDAQYVSPGVSVYPYTFPGRIQYVGVQGLAIVAPPQTGTIDAPSWTAISIDAATDAYIDNVVATEFPFGFVVGQYAKQVTIQDCSVTRASAFDISAGLPFHYEISGQRTLVQRSKSSGDNVFSYATEARVPGPNVLLNFVATAPNGPTYVEPHQRWATGLLVDNTSSSAPASKDKNGIDLIDRGYYGSGHGWTIGFGVVWNSSADDLIVQKPPGSMNWAIGSIGSFTTMAEPGNASSAPMPTGTIDSPGKRVAPTSLYLAQLCLRKGPSAIHAIGY